MRVWVVVLRFAGTTRVDLVEAENSQAAGADFIARCMAQPRPPELPLLALETCEVPFERLRELAGMALEPQLTRPPAPVPTLPVVGLCAAVRAYLGGLVDDADKAEARLRAFVEHHGVRMDFSTNRRAAAQ